MIDLEALKQTALKATPGPWSNRKAFTAGAYAKGRPLKYFRSLTTGVVVGSAQSPEPERGLNDAAFISAANPDTILRLIEVIHVQRRALEACAKEVEGAPYVGIDLGPTEGAVTACDALEAVREILEGQK